MESCVSTCSQSFYNENLCHAQLQPISRILKIENADGNELPYSGFVEVSVQVPGVPNSTEHQCLLLVVSDTSYHSKTPFFAWNKCY